MFNFMFKRKKKNTTVNIFVGNLAYSATEEDLRQVFKKYGPVTSVRIIRDKFTGKPRGFGFVEMGTNEGGNAAISKLDGHMIADRPIRVKEARVRTEGFRGHQQREQQQQRKRPTREW